jgi:hypothetical protein
MTLERLRNLLDAYGADPAHWPDDERATMQALIAASAPARAALAEAAALDALLAQDQPAMPLLNPVKIAAKAAAGARGAQPGSFQVRRMWPNVAGLAAAAIVGFVVGWTGLDQNFDFANVAAADQAESVSEAVLLENFTW